MVLVNYIETIINLLVPDKRTDNTIAFLSPIANQIQVNNNLINNVYRVGASYDEFDINKTYSRYDIVKYGKGVYYSAEDNNLGNYPNNPQWVLITNNFIGSDTRVYFNGTKIVFEYAINTYFGTMYQPNTQLNSEIYVETKPIDVKGFNVAATETFSDRVYKNTSTGYIRKTDTIQASYTLIIWVKDLGTPGKPTSDEIKNFANKYINTGIHFIIKSY